VIKKDYFLRLRVKNYGCLDAVIINTQLRRNKIINWAKFFFKERGSAFETRRKRRLRRLEWILRSWKHSDTSRD